MIFTTDACASCGHRGRATYGKTNEHGEPLGPQWDPPPVDCGCEPRRLAVPARHPGPGGRSVKITANRKALADACRTATVPAAANHLAILGGLRLDATAGGLTVCGTNLDLTVATDIEAQVEQAGTAILPGRLLSSLVAKAAGEEVTLTVHDDEATIEAGTTVATLRTLSLDDWPKVHTVDAERFELAPSDVARLGDVLHAVMTDTKALTNRPGLGGVHFAGNKAEATDSYRAAVAQLAVENLPGKIVPFDVVNRVTKASPKGLSFAFDNRSVTFDSEDGRTTWTSTLIAAEYPNIERLIRKDSPRALTVHRATLAEAVERVRLFADGDETHPLDFHVEDSKLRLTATRSDVGDITDELDCTGDWDQPIRFHDRYLADFIRHHDGEFLTFELDDPLKPVQTRTEDWRLVMLVMPVRRPVGS